MDKFKDIKDKYDSLFTILIYDLQLQEVIDKLFYRLEIIKRIKNTYKRKYLNDRLYGFIEYLKIIKEFDGGIFFISDEINEIKIKDTKILKEYNVNNFIFKYGNKFEIDYLTNLFEDFEFRHVIDISGNKFDHVLLNSTKKKTIHNGNINNVNSYIEENKNKYLIHGMSPKKILNKENYIFSQKLSDGEILIVFEKDEMRKKHVELSNVLSYLQNNKTIDKVIIGKNLSKKIKEYMIKELYCTQRMYDKLIQNVPNEFLNFKIIVVESLDKGDVADVLEKDFRGMIGVLYY